MKTINFRFSDPRDNALLMEGSQPIADKPQPDIVTPQTWGEVRRYLQRAKRMLQEHYSERLKVRKVKLDVRITK